MKITSDCRIIKTPFYSKIAGEIMRSVLGQLSDGWGENNPRNDRYWRFCDVEAAPDGQVLIKISNENCIHDRYSNSIHTTWNAFMDDKFKSDEAVLAWFARLIKKTMLMELKDSNVEDGWKRINDEFETAYLNYKEKITVAHVYAVYEVLLGKFCTNRYDVQIISDVYGSKKTAAEAAAEERKRARIEAISAEWCKKRDALEVEKKAAIKKIEEEYAKKVDALNTKMFKLKKQLEKE